MDFDEAVSQFSNHLVPGGTIVSLTIQPIKGSIFHRCFENVEKKIEEAKGSMQLGWVIWTHEDIFMIEAEFHAVWKSPEGHLIDVTPQKDGEKVVKFLVDPEIVRRSHRIDNVRRALSNDLLVMDNIELHKLKNMFLIAIEVEPRSDLNPDRAASASGINELIVETEKSIRAGKKQTDDCYCGSRVPYIRCHHVDVVDMTT